VQTNKYCTVEDYVIARKVIPNMRRAFPDGGRKFQSDIAPCLSSKKVKTIFRKQKWSTGMLDWPGNWPDLNPLRICDQ